MCTCIGYKNGDFYFGRNLDLECHFGEKVVMTPRNYPFSFRRLPEMKHHYAMIGMAAVEEHYPLYAEGVNECGVGIAGLYFPGNAWYGNEQAGKKNVAPYELIPWILGQCTCVREACARLKEIQLLDLPFREDLPPAPLHWMVADKKASVVVESGKEGIRIYDNSYGVLTNNPPFPFYEIYLKHYMNLTNGSPKGDFAEKLHLKPYGEGMGGMGLPGDWSPASRFVRAVFLKENSLASRREEENVTQFFHILDGVSMVRGVVAIPDGGTDYTCYSCCVNTEKGIYYYKTYENNRIQAIDMKKENLEEKELKIFPIGSQQEIHWQN